MRYSKLSQKFFLLVSVGLFSHHATAQQPPDAGTLLKQQPKPPVQQVVPKKIKPMAPIGQSEEEAGAKVLVKGFLIKGAILIPEAELQAQIKDGLGKELSFSQLKEFTFRLINYYVRKGYLARVILPPQEITDGIIEIQVIEGKRGSLNIDNQGKFIDSARVQGFIDYRLPTGGPMSLSSLGETMNILNDQPGIESKVTLAPGEGEGITNLVVTAADKPAVTSNAELNNEGSRGTGEYQAQGAFTLNNPSGRFDAASLLVNVAEGSRFLRADYSSAVGYAGLRLGINVSRLNYDVVQDGLTALDPHGTATTYGLYASYPLARRDDFSLSVTGSYDNKKLVDRTNVGETSNQTNTVTSLGVSGVAQSNTPIMSGTTYFGANVNFGDSSQHNASALAADNTTRQVEGSFSKLSYNLAYIHPVSPVWSLTSSLRGQFASRNLNSTERFSLGGSSGVRGYPVGEGSGDEGWLFSLNARRIINFKLAVNVFADAGGTKINNDTWTNWNASNPQLKNSYELYGVGTGLDWRLKPNALLRATLAVPVGDNPGRDSNDHNVDGRDDKQPHLWLNLSAQF